MTIKRFLILLGISNLLANSILIYITFIQAYLHDYKTVVYINDIGEAHIEFIMIPVLLVISIFAVAYLERKNYDDVDF